MISSPGCCGATAGNTGNQPIRIERLGRVEVHTRLMVLRHLFGKACAVRATIGACRRTPASARMRRVASRHPFQACVRPVGRHRNPSIRPLRSPRPRPLRRSPYDKPHAGKILRCNGSWHYRQPPGHGARDAPPLAGRPQAAPLAGVRPRMATLARIHFLRLRCRNARGSHPSNVASRAVTARPRLRLD